MDTRILSELERVTANSAIRREDLLLSGLRKSRKRKVLNVAAGILALTSAGAITSVVADLFGDKGVQGAAALVAGVSGAISLIISAYFSDDEILSMLTGSSKYLALRESVYRLVVEPGLSDEKRYDRLSPLQEEYAKLDEKYSRYFSVKRKYARGLPDGTGTRRPPVERWRKAWRAEEAAENDISELHRRLWGGPAGTKRGQVRMAFG